MCGGMCVQSYALYEEGWHKFLLSKDTLMSLLLSLIVAWHETCEKFNSVGQYFKKLVKPHNFLLNFRKHKMEILQFLLIKRGNVVADWKFKKLAFALFLVGLNDTRSDFYVKSNLFLSAIWLPHSQLWAIIDDIASFAQSYSLHFLWRSPGAS